MPYRKHNKKPILREISPRRRLRVHSLTPPNPLSTNLPRLQTPTAERPAEIPVVFTVTIFQPSKPIGDNIYPSSYTSGCNPGSHKDDPNLRRVPDAREMAENAGLRVETALSEALFGILKNPINRRQIIVDTSRGEGRRCRGGEGVIEAVAGM